ncbi:MAG: transporter substrate-binding domain-containing protein, partial [Sulfurimonas sp.]|nr:transporter substrate-binding domain-containing protein [Sulfurimonas sp.]
MNYIHCEWAECLNMLETGNIDIMPDVAFTAQRNKKFLFSHEPVISSWSVIYRHIDVEIESIFDLKKKKIAVLKDSIQYFAIKDILKKFNIETPNYINVKNFAEAFRLLENKQVDSVIVNRFYELSHAFSNNIVKTNIVIKPSTLRYAFSQSRKNMANIVTNHIKEFKKNKQSILYKSKKKWLTLKKSVETPKWLLWSLIGSITIILFLVFFVIIFKRMVVKTSKKLIEREKIMLMQSKQAAIGEMVGFIAHQWRQPLSVIGMSSNNIKVSIELEEKITTQNIEEFVQIVLDQVKHLSETIDDFSNFFKPNKNMTITEISSLLDKLKRIYANSLESNNIELVLQNEQD